MLRSTAAVLLLLQVALCSAQHGAKWTYNGPEGENHWHKHYPFCGGAFQSPIDMAPALLRFDPHLRPIELRNYNLSADEQLTLGNNGHAVQVSLPSKMHMSGLPHRYTAAQLHFHWGSSGRPSGSEHLVNGKQFAAEMHIVHFNSDKYANVSVAKDKEDGLAVLGVLIEVGAFNPAFDQFLKFINGIKYRDERVQVPGFNIRGLLPARLDEYYRYDGSLTTPPCYPSVLWTVFRNPVTVSPKQFQSLASAVYSSHAQDTAPVPLSGNFRKPQLPDDRLVLVSFKEGRGLHGTLRAPSPLVRRQIIQQLLDGDLADLADEGLYQLLPSGPERPRVGKKSKDYKYKYSRAQANPRKPQSEPSLWKKYQTLSHAGALGLPDETLCFPTLVQQVSSRLQQAHADELVQALREAVFPRLNLRSYLECKSDLALATIRHMLRRRPTDEAFELDRSLTNASIGRKKTASAAKQAIPESKNQGPDSSILSKSHRQGSSHPWLEPMEFED